MAHTATTLMSVTAHNKAIVAHWIYQSITEVERRGLQKCFQKEGATLIFYPAPAASTSILPIDKHASAANYFRLYAADLLPRDVARVIYLDSDVIARKPLSDLWTHDLNNLPLAAIQNPLITGHAGRLGLQEDQYFNSGVMLLDLDRWRQTNLRERVVNFINQNQHLIQYWDQDGLNAVLHGQWSRLPPMWNVQHIFFRDPSLRIAYADLLQDPPVVHFSGQHLKPWQYELQHPFKSEYRRFRRRTPWPYYKECNTPPLLKRAKSALRQLAEQPVVARLLGKTTAGKFVEDLLSLAFRQKDRQAAQPVEPVSLTTTRETRHAKTAEIINTVFNSSRLVRTGPFRGMNYSVPASGSQTLPKIAGTYEQPIQEYLTAIGSEMPIRRIINMGSAEGYYSVGLALRNPAAKIFALDYDEEARQRCASLAADNAVSQQIVIEKNCTHQVLNDIVDAGTFLLCDIEGAEIELIDPLACPSIKACSMLVEVHDFLRPGATDSIIERFRNTHRIVVNVDYPRDLTELREALRSEGVEVPDETLGLITDEVRPPGMRWLYILPLNRVQAS